MTDTNLYEMLYKIKDPRDMSKIKYPLPMMLTIVIMALMSWYNWARAIWDFIERNNNELLKIFKTPENTIPHYTQILTTISLIDFDEFANVFKKWACKYHNISNKTLASIDWKAIRWTLTNANGSSQRYINLVSIFMQDEKMTLTIKQLESKKTNEIPVVQDLLKELWMEWLCYTLDAMHCQKETTKVIKETGNDYIIWVKWNQKSLYEEIKKKHQK